MKGSVEGHVEWRLSVDCVQIAVAWAHTKAAFCANADGAAERSRRRRREANIAAAVVGKVAESKHNNNNKSSWINSQLDTADSWQLA